MSLGENNRRVNCRGVLLTGGLCQRHQCETSLTRQLSTCDSDAKPLQNVLPKIILEGRIHEELVGRVRGHPRQEAGQRRQRLLGHGGHLGGRGVAKGVVRGTGMDDMSLHCCKH